MNILHIDSSILSVKSITRKLSSEITQKIAKRQRSKITYRDLAIDDLSHVNVSTLPSHHPISKSSYAIDPAVKVAQLQSDHILQEFLDADVVVIGAPMYNFTIPSQLKSWLDRILVPNKTFRYTQSGPEGLATEKCVVIAIASGGFYYNQTAEPTNEHVQSYLRTVFGFIGIEDVEFVIAEGTSLGEESMYKSIENAQRQIDKLVETSF